MASRRTANQQLVRPRLAVPYLLPGLLLALTLFAGLLVRGLWGEPGGVGDTTAGAASQVAAPAVDHPTGSDPAAGLSPHATDRVELERRTATGALRVRAVAVGKDGTRAPLVDLGVVVYSGAGSHEPVDGVAHRLRTDALGEAVLDALPPGLFAVRAPSLRATVQRATVVAGAAVGVELAAEGADLVRGRVVDANGRPVADAELWLVRDSRRDEFGIPMALELGSRCAGHSAADGTFAVFAIDPRERRIAASHVGIGESMARYVQGGRHELRLELLPTPAALRVACLDQDDRPVAGAEVEVRVGSDSARRTRDGTLVAGRRSRWGRTGADGTCVFPDLPAGRATVTAEADRGAVVVHDVDLQPGAPNALVLRVQPGVLVHGTVRSARGLPANVAVRIQPSLGTSGALAECTVRPDGSYRLHAAARQPFVVAVSLGNRTLAHRHVPEPGPGRLRLDFELEAGAVTMGTVRSPDGAPIVAWRVQLAARDGSNVHGLTDARGEFALATPFAGPAVLEVHCPGAMAPSLVQLAVEPGAHLELIVPQHGLPRGTVLGRVVDAAGLPVAASLRLRSPAPRRQHDLELAADGTFRFEGLAPLTYVLEHRHSGNATPLRNGIVVADAAAVDLGTLALPATGRLQVDVVDEFDRPWAGSQVGFTLTDERGDDVAVDHVTIDDRLAVAAVPGRYWLGVLATDLLCERVPVTIEAGRTGRARLAVRVGRTLRFRFPSPLEVGSAEARALRVTILTAHGTTLGVETVTPVAGAAGQRAAWTLGRVLPFGLHRIEASTEDGLRFAMHLEVTEAFDSGLVVEVPVAR